MEGGLVVAGVVKGGLVNALDQKRFSMIQSREKENQVRFLLFWELRVFLILKSVFRKCHIFAALFMLGGKIVKF